MGKIMDLIVLVVIAIIGLVTAYVSFGILESQAEFERTSGAIAGALISWSVLGGLYHQIRQSSGEIEDLRERNKQLQQKLIRGAPHPDNYEIEISEKQRIVLSRPKTWVHRGGTLFEYELPVTNKTEGDLFPALMSVSFAPIPKDSESQDDFYQAKKENFENEIVDYGKVLMTEFQHIGGQPQPIKSLKMVFKKYAKVTTYHQQGTGQEIHDRDFISQRDYVTENVSDKKQDLNSVENISYVSILHMLVICYHKKLDTIFYFNFYDDEKDFSDSTTKFNQVLDSTRFLI